jgi:hypothetical protein
MIKPKYNTNNQEDGKRAKRKMAKAAMENTCPIQFDTERR